MQKKSKEIRTQKKTATIFYILTGIIGIVAGYIYQSNQEIPTPPSRANFAKAQSSNLFSSEDKNEIIEKIKEARPFLKNKFSEIYFPIIQNEMLEHDNDTLREILKFPNFWTDFANDKKTEIDKLDADYADLTTKFYARFSVKELLEYLNIFTNADYLKVNAVIEKDLRSFSAYEQNDLKIRYFDRIENFTMQYLDESIPQR